jgi:hypothetical protein
MDPYLPPLWVSGGLAGCRRNLSYPASNRSENAPKLWINRSVLQATAFSSMNGRRNATGEADLTLGKAPSLGFVVAEEPSLLCASEHTLVMGFDDLWQYFHKVQGNVCVQWTVPHPARPNNQFMQVCDD